MAGIVCSERALLRSVSYMGDRLCAVGRPKASVSGLTRLKMS